MLWTRYALASTSSLALLTEVLPVLAVGDAHNQLQIWDMKRRITAEALQDRGQTIVHLRNRRVLGYSFLRVACVSANAAASSNSSVAGHGGPDEQPVKHDGYVAAVAVGEFHQALGGQRAAQFIWSVTSHGRLTQWRTSFRAPASYTPTPVPADTWQFEPQLEIVSGSSIPCSPLTDFSGSGHFEPFRAPPLLLRYDADSQLLCAGTQDGHVRVYRTAPEPFVETTQYMLPDSEEDPTRLRLLSVANAPPSGPVVGMSVTTAPPCLDGGAAKHGGEDDPKPLESVIAVACAEGWVHLYGIPASSEGEGALGVRPLHLLQSISAVADQEEEEEEGVEAAMTVSGVSSRTRASGHESSLAAGAGQLIGCCFNAWRDTGPRQADGESAEGPANGALAACSRGGEVMLWPAGELFVDEEESGVVSESAGAGFEIELPESLLEPLDWTAVSEPTSGTEGYNTGEGTTYVQASYTTSSSEGRFEHSATTDPSTTFEAAAGAEAHTTTPSAGQIWGADGSAVATTATTTHTTGSFTSDPAPASSRAALVDWMKTVSSTDNDSLGNSQGAPSLPDTTGLAEATPVPRQLPLWNPSPAPKRPPPTAGPTPSPDRLKPTRTPPTATTSPRRSSPVRAQPSPAPVHPTSTATVPPTSTAATPQEPVSASPRTHPNPARPAEDDKELAYVSSVRVDREWWNPARVAAYLPQADGEAEDDAPSGPSKFENPLAVPSLHSSKLYYQALERAREARLTDSALNAEADKLAEEMIQRHELPDGTTYGRHERVFPPQEPPSQPQPPVVPKAVDGEWLSARELWRPVLPSWMDVMRRATGLQPPTAAGVMPAVGAEAELASLRGLACHPVAAVGGEEWKQVPAVSGPGAARPVVFRR